MNDDPQLGNALRSMDGWSLGSREYANRENGGPGERS